MCGLLRKLLFCSIILGITLPSYGETPAPPVNADKSKQQSANPQKKSSADQRGTEQAPLIIKVLPSTQNTEPTANAKEQHEGDAAYWLWQQWLEHWPEILLALFTLGLWYATAQLVRDAKDTARRQLRAYVFMHISTKPYPPSDPNRYAISLIVTNGGKTWARNLRIKMEVIPQKRDDARDPFDLMNQDVMPPMVLGPGQTLDLQFHDVLRSDVPEIASGNIRRSYIAVVRYEDTVSPTAIIRQTQLSMRLNADTEGGISFGYLPTHNCADEDCQS